MALFALCSASARVSGQRRPNNTALQRVISQTYIDHHGFQVHTDTLRVYPQGLDAAHAARIGRYLGHPLLATSHLTAYTCTHRRCGVTASKSLTGTSIPLQR